MPLCKTKVLLKISEHKMLSFSLRKEIIENDNSLVDISFSKIGENEFSSDFIANLEMLKLQENGRNDQYIFSRVVTYFGYLPNCKVSRRPYRPASRNCLEK